MASQEPHQGVVAGGGVAGLETLLALRELATERVALTLITPEKEFVYRPMAVAAPFARGRARHHDLADIAADVGATLVTGALDRVDDARRVAVLTDGREVGF
jgi:sulfide:quinone oxidoreductase